MEQLEVNKQLANKLGKVSLGITKPSESNAITIPSSHHEVAIPGCGIVTARWDISTHCNLNCLQCCAEGLFDNNPDHLDADSAINLLEILWENDIKHLNILGREPFLHPHINTILQYACQKGFQVDITTNGTTIKDKDISFLVSLGLRNIFFSIDGSSPDINDTIRGDGVFDKVLSTLQKFVAEKERQKSSLQINVNTTLTKINAFDVPNIVDLCSRNRVNLFKLSHLDPIGNASRHLNSLFLKPDEEFTVAEEVMKIIPNHQDLKFNIISSKPKVLEYFYEKYKVVFPVGITGCKACRKEIYIGPTGDISPCLSMYMDYSNNSNRCYKYNVFDIKENQINKFFDEFRSSYPLIPNTYKNYIPCDSCPYLTTLCYPCPLNGSDLDELCLIAETKMKENKELK